MTSPLHPSQGHGGANGSTEAARAHEAVAHGRAHLDYQRRVATAGVDRNDTRMMSHGEKLAAARGWAQGMRDAKAFLQAQKDDRP